MHVIYIYTIITRNNYFFCIAAIPIFCLFISNHGDKNNIGKITAFCKTKNSCFKLQEPLGRSTEWVRYSKKRNEIRQF